MQEYHGKERLVRLEDQSISMKLPEPWSAPPSPKAASGQFQASKRNWWWHSDTASSTAAVTLEVSLALCCGRKDGYHHE